MSEESNIATFRLPDGRVVSYIPVTMRPELAAVRRVKLEPRDRLDNLAYELFGDPLNYPALCDANRALNPLDLLAENVELGVPGDSSGG